MFESAFFQLFEIQFQAVQIGTFFRFFIDVPDFQFLARNSHRHITVNGRVLNIPSYAVKVGDIVAVRERSKSLEVIEASLAGFNHAKYPWLEWDEAQKAGKFMSIPAREDIPENIKEQLIVELYSKN